MTLPLGRTTTTHSNPSSSPPTSYDLLDNVPILSRGTGPRPLSHSGVPASSSANAHLTPAAAQRHNTPSRPGLVFLDSTAELSALSSPSSSAMNTPLHSRPPSPLPQFYSAPSSGSDTDSDEPGSPLLLDTYTTSDAREGWPRWWRLRQRARRRPRRPAGWGCRSMVRVLRRVFRHPFFPKHPSTIVRFSSIFLAPLARIQLNCHEQLLSLLFFSILAASITFLLIHLLNPDKEPLPWRAYCTIPEASSDPPPFNAHPTFLNISTVASAPPMPPFPPSNFEELPPAGVFVGVFSVDSSSERRMLIRATWASHPRSRNGAGSGDGGAGTSRTIVRFIMGQPRKSWDRRVRVEMEGACLLWLHSAHPLIQWHCHMRCNRVQ